MGRFDHILPGYAPNNQTVTNNESAQGNWQDWQKGPAINLPDPMQSYKSQLTPFPLPQPIQSEQIPNPVVGQNLFLLNAFPIHKNDNFALKGIKGLGNVVASTFDAPVEALRKLSLQGGSLLSGNGLRNDLPKNTTFTGDILPKGASDTLNTFQMKHPVLGGLANAAIETAVDPTMFMGEKAVSNFLRPKSEIGMLKPLDAKAAQAQFSNSDVPQAPVRADIQTPNQSIKQPNIFAQNSNEQAVNAPKIDLPSSLKAPVESPLLKQYGDISKWDNNTYNNTIGALVSENNDKLNKLIDYYTNYKPRGVDQGGVGFNADGDVATAWGRISNNEPWYQALYQQLSHKPSKAELRQFAIDELTKGRSNPLEGTIPPDKSFIQNVKDIENLSQLRKTSIPQNEPLKVMASKIETPSLQSPTLQSSMSQTGATLESPLFKNRQFAENSVLNSQVATDPLKEIVKSDMPTYEPITNKGTFDKATGIVNQDYTKAVSTFSDAKHGVNADDVALGEALISKAIREGNPDEANRLIADLAEKLTTAGQAVQAASIFKRLTPEGMLLYAQRMVNRANRDLFDRLGKKAQKIILTSDDSNFILDTMKNVQKLPEGRERDVELAKVMAKISNKVPATNGEKVKALQRITMLLNPKTMIRNTVGNVLFGAIDNASNVLATPIDKGIGKITGQRTTTLPSLTGQLKSMKKGVNETIQDARLGIETYPAQTQFELPNKRIFDTEGLNKLDKATRTGLQLGDRPFFQAAYDDVLRQQMKLAKVNTPTQAMQDQAMKIAKERTYQDTNKITQAADGLRDAFNKLGGKDFGAGNIILPFTKTPANILKRAVEYSPIGLEKTVRETINLVKKNGKFDQKGFVDSISRSATGTGMIMAGYELAQKGVITGTGNKDADIASFERNLGKNDFAVKMGDTYYTYDWAQPASLALAVGADMFIKGRDKKQAQNAIIEGIKSGGETLLKQSFLQGVQRLFGGYAPMDNIESTAYNAPAQFIPTLSNQITQLIDPQKRSTASDTVQGKALNSIKAKIPGLSQTLEPSIDTLGNPIQQYQGNNNIGNVFLNPGRMTQFKPNKVQADILKVYESTGNKNIFPKVAPKSFTSKGDTITLTPKEITKFQQAMGKQTQTLLEPISLSSYADEQKAKLMQAAIEKAYENAKQEVLNNRK